MEGGKGMGMGTVTGTGKQMERAVWRGWNRTGNGEREGLARAGRAAELENENAYFCRECAGVLGGIRGGGRRYNWDLHYS